MHRARANLLREIDSRRTRQNNSRRVLAEVRTLYVRPGNDGGPPFVSGTARTGLETISFDNYSFQGGRAGFFLGPVYLPPTLAPHEVVKKPVGKQPGTYLYGRVVVAEDGRHVFHSVVAADQLHFFVNTLRRGRAFVKAHAQRYMIGDSADLFAAASVLTGGIHVLLHQCLKPDKRPPDFRPLNLTVNPVEFVLLLSFVCASSEPFKRFCSVLRSRRQTVEPAVFRKLRLSIEGAKKTTPITAGHVHKFAQQLRREQEILFEDCDEDDDESEGSDFSD